ncbi:subunit 4 of DNA polymerase delta [Chloropicon roscoffensis]|uniref:Subunit 4 of DNA polymerase delta n=2 Tax=Chloropicon roscoffensis TaxID=1461544 RepID=A0AAX4NX34_9CHLO
MVARRPRTSSEEEEEEEAQAMGGHLRRTKGRKLSREQVAPGRGSRELFWCVCHVQHGVRGWCYCSLDGEQQVGFLEAAKRVGWDVKGYGTVGAEAPAPSPKTPALDQLLPAFAPSRLGSATLSALLTERGRAALKRCRHSGGRPLGSGRAGEGARRSLDADFARSLGGAGRSESEEGSAWPEDEEASACEGSERSEGGSSDEEEEVECMPWHFWMCSGCGRRLPEGHMNCAGKVLRRFDLASKYGPCVGITRMERWIRARDLGLDPPASVCDILARSENRDVTDRALWG